MWRSLFMAVGFYVFLVGAQCLVVDKFVMRSRMQSTETDWIGNTQVVMGPQREYVPTEWAPWSFMAGGSVIWLYAIAISNKMKK